MDLKGAILRSFYNVGTLVTQPNPENFFSLKIPHYQRPYKWDDERVSRLIFDWQDNRLSSEDTSKEYFAGAVVTVADQRKTDEHSLIDGQQRITTLFLANFINFILLRNLILFEIERKRCGKIESYSDSLRKATQFVFRDKNIIEHFKHATERLKQLSDDDKMDELHTQEDNYMKEFYDLLWLPQHTYEEYPLIEDYQEAVVHKIYNHLNDNALNLHYDRSSFNSSLNRVLSQFYFVFEGNSIPLKYKIWNESQLSENETIYSNALITIIKTLEKITPKHGVFHTYAHNLHTKLAEFLDEVKVCVIQTGATDDAYTLFEVMNDRALELDDLDLIKNQFFKEFVQKNKNLTESEIDSNIQKLDKQWGDDIFNHQKMRIQDKKLVTYLGTVFLTGDEDITNTKNEKYRLYLDKYLDKQKEYTYESIQRDFNIFKICFELINQLSLPLQKRESESLVVEYKMESTDFRKTIFFLNALKQDGVTSGLVNFLLKAIGEFNPSFEITPSINFIKLLLEIDYYEESTIKKFFPKSDTRQIEKLQHLTKKIQEQSKSLWTTSMMALNAAVPRELSKRIIKDNHLLSSSSYALAVHNPPYDTANLAKDFTEWLRHWNYNKDLKFKIKTLFARILKFGLSEGELINSPVKMTIDTNQIRALDLDHLVAENHGDDGIFSFDHKDRELYIHDLGNMMPLPKKENIQKSDYPLEKSLQYYEISGLTKHFLLDEVKSLIELVRSEEIDPLTFFSKRKDLLVKYFNEIVRV